MRELLERLIIRQKGGAAAMGDVQVLYRHEQPWGVPCTLDFYREETRRDARGNAYLAAVLPEGIELLVQDAAALVDELVRPPSSIVIASGAGGISILWRVEKTANGRRKAR